MDLFWFGDLSGGPTLYVLNPACSGTGANGTLRFPKSAETKRFRPPSSFTKKVRPKRGNCRIRLGMFSVFSHHIDSDVGKMLGRIPPTTDFGWLWLQIRKRNEKDVQMFMQVDLGIQTA